MPDIPEHVGDGESEGLVHGAGGRLHVVHHAGEGGPGVPGG